MCEVLMTLTYALTRRSTNIGNARIQGMQEDLKLVGYRFNWVTSVFYIVYMFVEGMCLHRSLLLHR